MSHWFLTTIRFLISLIEEQDARNYYFEKIKKFKADCEEDMDEFPYIEKENEVQLEECFIVNFSQYNLD